LRLESLEFRLHFRCTCQFCCVHCCRCWHWRSRCADRTSTEAARHIFIDGLWALHGCRQCTAGRLGEPSDSQPDVVD